MKILTLMILGLGVVGCGKEVSFTEKDIVGIYEYETNDRRSNQPGKKIKARARFFEDGSTSIGGLGPGRWKIVGKEVHVFHEKKTNKMGNRVFVTQPRTNVYKRFLDGHSSIDGHLTLIANIKDGIRKDIPKGAKPLIKKSHNTIPTKNRH